MKKITWRFITLLIYASFTFKKIQQFFLSFKKGKNKTKVFCIGSIKTGTSSLYKALKILGYKSVRLYEVPTFGKKGPEVYVKKLKDSSFEAFSDTPIGYQELYKKIDQEIPGSKFILTIRDPKSQEKSYSNYFKNHPWSFVTENISEKINSYKKRNEEVKRYFKDRKDDLLIMNIIEGDGWEKLCKFLDKPIPDKQFPRKNVGKYRKKQG